MKKWLLVIGGGYLLLVLYAQSRDAAKGVSVRFSHYLLHPSDILDAIQS